MSLWFASLGLTAPKLCKADIFGNLPPSRNIEKEKQEKEKQQKDKFEKEKLEKEKLEKEKLEKEKLEKEKLEKEKQQQQQQDKQRGKGLFEAGDMNGGGLPTMSENLFGSSGGNPKSVESSIFGEDFSPAPKKVIVTKAKDSPKPESKPAAPKNVTASSIFDDLSSPVSNNVTPEKPKETPVAEKPKETAIAEKPKETPVAEKPKETPAPEKETSAVSNLFEDPLAKKDDKPKAATPNIFEDPTSDSKSAKKKTTKKKSDKPSIFD